MPEKLFSIGSNELVVSNLAHTMKEKQMIENKISFFFLESKIVFETVLYCIV